MNLFLILLFIVFSFIKPVELIPNETQDIQYETPALYPFECDLELEGILETLRQLTEVEDLLAQILMQGPLYIKVNRYHSNAFEGYWDFYERTIYVTNPRRHSESQLLSTLLFEMHNASRNSDFQKICQLAHSKKINKKKYIEKIEYIEFQNAIATTAILEKGIKRGLFPKESYWRVTDNFEEYLKIQKAAGHSAEIGKGY